MFQRKDLEAYYIVLGKPTLSEQLEPDRLNLFRNGVTWLYYSVNILTLKYLFSGVLILNSTITFSKSDPRITFFCKFGPLLEMKLGTKGIWWCWFRDRQLFFKFCAKLIQCLINTFFWGNFGQRNPVQWDIQECKFWTQFLYPLFL